MTEECEIIRRKYEDQLNINELENYVKKMIFLEKKYNIGPRRMSGGSCQGDGLGATCSLCSKLHTVF